VKNLHFQEVSILTLPIDLALLQQFFHFRRNDTKSGNLVPRACDPWEGNEGSEQVGNLSAHALQFARFKRKRLGASKYSNLISERFIGVLVSFFLLTKKLLIHCIVGNTRKV
jgi:hypothetical protein